MNKPESPEVLAVANEEGDHEKAGSATMRRSKLLNRQPIPVCSDVSLHGLPPHTLESLRRAVDQGLVPSGLDFGGNDNSIVVLRLSRPFKSRLLHRLVADEEMIRHVALELVRLGREIPETSWHEGAEDYAVAIVRRLVEIARDEGFIMKHKTVVNLGGRNTEAWIQPDEYVPGWWTMVYWDWRQNITHVIVRRTEAEAKAELDKFVAQHGRAREGQNSAW